MGDAAGFGIPDARGCTNGLACDVAGIEGLLRARRNPHEMSSLPTFTQPHMESVAEEIRYWRDVAYDSNRRLGIVAVVSGCLLSAVVLRYRDYLSEVSIGLSGHRGGPPDSVEADLQDRDGDLFLGNVSILHTYSIARLPCMRVPFAQLGAYTLMRGKAEFGQGPTDLMKPTFPSADAPSSVS